MGGYETEPGKVARHFWLALGPRLALFDPTAHQFDAYGAVTIDRYWVQARSAHTSFIDWRRGELGS